MWPFKQTPKEVLPEEYDVKWREKMLLRWTDLEARVTALEMLDKEYKKRHRRKIEPEEEENLNIGKLIAV